MALAVLAACLVTSPTHAQEGGSKRKRAISPYIEAGAVLTSDLQTGDVLTYSTVAAGIDASIQSRRVQVALSYKYERRFELQGNLADSDVHSGLMRANVAVMPGFSIESGAVATRARFDQRGPAPGNLAGNVSNVSQIYSVYAGPSVATRVGPLHVSGNYRFGYTKAEAPGVATGVPAGQPVLDVFDSNMSHSANAALALRSGSVLPVGLTVSGGWDHDEASQLDQSYDSKRVRGDAVLPIGMGFAVAGGVGYEQAELSQKDPLRDAGGNIVRDANGRFVTDPASPERKVQISDGIYWDAGIVWRPSRRTMLEARVGRRYDSWSYTGSFSYVPSNRLAIAVAAYDQVQGFGRQLTQGLAMLPTSFTTTIDPFSDQFAGCVFGDGGAAGGCLNPALSSISASYYRARGVDGALSITNGPLRMGLGLGYTTRRFISPVGAPGFTVNGTEDSSVYAQLNISRELDARSGVTGALYANYFDTGIGTAGPVFGGGAMGAYYRRIGPINATASLGIYTFDIEGVGNDVSAQAMLGVRYGF